MLVTRLRSVPGVLAVEVQHIYREYNADADGICNSVLDAAESGMAPDEQGRLVSWNWENFQPPDVDGDVVMR